MAANQDLVPNGAKGLQGSSKNYALGTTPNTRTAVSQKVRLLAPSYGSTAGLSQMGVVSSFGFSESRGVDTVRGIGFGDQVAELVPSVTEPGSLSVERALLYLANIWQATGYAAGVDGPVRSLKHHRWPFDMEQQIVFSNIADNDLGNTQGGQGFQAGVTRQIFPFVTPDGQVRPTPGNTDQNSHNALLTIFETCWWNDFSHNFAADSGIIMESGTATCTDVHDGSTIYGEFLATGNDPSIGQVASSRFETQFI